MLSRTRATDASGGGDGYETLLFGPFPERSDHARDLLPGTCRARAPRIDHVAQVLDADLDGVLIGQEETHAGKDRLVVANGRWRGSILVSKPAEANLSTFRCFAGYDQSTGRLGGVLHTGADRSRGS